MCDVSLRKTSAADILNMAGERLILTARCWTKIIQQLLWRYWVKSLPSVHWNEVRRPRLVVNMNSGGDWCFSFRSAVLSVNWPNTSIWSRGIKDSIPHSCRRQCQTAVSNSTTHPTVSFRKFWHTSHFAQEFIFIYGLYILYVYIYVYTRESIWDRNCNALGDDRPQPDRYAPCVIAQQYSSAVSLRLQSVSDELFRVIICYWFIFFFDILKIA